ncbi:MAG TPA: hypothetical protein VF546_13985 [Pyrinomonadaceae bacterium]|jgi:hypothetical protein
MAEHLPFTTAERSDDAAGYSEELAARFKELTQIIVPPHGMEHPYDADEIAAALCELIDWFTYQSDMTDRENMACEVVAAAFEHTDAKDSAENGFRSRRLVLAAAQDQTAQEAEGADG